MNDEIEQVDISNLLLDPENPRLPESVGRDQIAMLDYIAETTADTFLRNSRESDRHYTKA